MSLTVSWRTNNIEFNDSSYFGLMEDFMCGAYHKRLGRLLVTIQANDRSGDKGWVCCKHIIDLWLPYFLIISTYSKTGYLSRIMRCVIRPKFAFFCYFSLKTKPRCHSKQRVTKQCCHTGIKAEELLESETSCLIGKLRD